MFPLVLTTIYLIFKQFFRFLKARIRFNKAPNQALSLLILSETTEVMALTADGTVILSYKEPVQKV